jgi:hypothetical protein
VSGLSHAGRISQLIRFLKDFSAKRIDVGMTTRKPVQELIPTRASLLARIKDTNDGASWQGTSQRTAIPNLRARHNSGAGL